MEGWVRRGGYACGEGCGEGTYGGAKVLLKVDDDEGRDKGLLGGHDLDLVMANGDDEMMDDGKRVTLKKKESLRWIKNIVQSDFKVMER